MQIIVALPPPIDLEATVVFDETEFLEFIHEEVHARARRTDHFDEGFLGDLVDHRLGLAIAERLKCCRAALGWSQRELARRIGVYPSTVERWESGQRKPGVGHLTTLERLEDLVNRRA